MSTPSPASDWQAHYAAEYDFYRKIIEDEVARNRWNQGFEPLDCDLYELKDQGGRITYYGKVRICHRDFLCTATPALNSEGKRTLKLSIRVQARQNH